MKHSNVWYIDARAEQLAIVYLTRNPTLEILPPSLDALDLDYLVRIHTAHPQQLRVFGVQVTGVLDRSSLWLTADNQGELTPDIDQSHSLALPENMPICQLLFIMETDEGFYRWIQEPDQDAQGQPILHHLRTKDFQRLDKASLMMIVEQVNGWYNAQETRPRTIV